MCVQLCILRAPLHIQTSARPNSQAHVRHRHPLSLRVFLPRFNSLSDCCFDLVEYCRNIPFQRILWQPICWTNSPTNQKNSAENLKRIGWWTKSHKNWFDVSLPLNFKEEMFLFMLIGARCCNRAEEVGFMWRHTPLQWRPLTPCAVLLDICRGGISDLWDYCQSHYFSFNQIINLWIIINSPKNTRY